MVSVISYLRLKNNTFFWSAQHTPAMINAFRAGVLYETTGLFSVERMDSESGA